MATDKNPHKNGLLGLCLLFSLNVGNSTSWDRFQEVRFYMGLKNIDFIEVLHGFYRLVCWLYLGFISHIGVIWVLN